jgi:septal ring factor EnvC (AmiA/AmiB activator)
MKCNWTLVSLSLAAVCGLALAQQPVPKPAPPKLDALQKEVAMLRDEVAALKKAVPPPAANTDKLAAELKETRALVEQLVAYVRAQAEGAGQLSQVLADSEKKGFTYGINPDSRIVLLQGLNSFVDALQTNLPVAKAPVATPAPTPPKR